MELYLFIIGFLVSCLVIASVFLSTKRKKISIRIQGKANEMDYDGMGNCGRFPQKISLFFSRCYKTFTK